MLLANLDPGAALYEDKWPWDWSWFTDLLISWLLNLQLYVRDSRCNCRKIARRLLKQIQRFVKLLRQKDCRGAAGVFKILPRQLYCRRLCSWNANADSGSPHPHPPSPPSVCEGGGGGRIPCQGFLLVLRYWYKGSQYYCWYQQMNLYL